MSTNVAVSATVLFDRPQVEIASAILDRLKLAVETRIVTGFLTPAGLEILERPIRSCPKDLQTLVVGAATYPAFEALDRLLAVGVPEDRLSVHLGHTGDTGGRKNPYARYRPMLHTKIYYMELPDSQACAFVGSNNMTSFALAGLNGEAAILLEGPVGAPEFSAVRDHIAAARAQAVQYSPAMKEAYAWWAREYFDGLKAEIGIPQDWSTVRTILLFAAADGAARPKIGDNLYFEIPAGIEQIESLKTETHLFLFDPLPSDPSAALAAASSARAHFKCRTLGAENKQGNQELRANWQVRSIPRPTLSPVPSGILRPTTPGGMQQVRAEIESATLPPYEYLFEREKQGWDPKFSADEMVPIKRDAQTASVLVESRGEARPSGGWRLVTGLVQRGGPSLERDQAALKLAAPESGAFILVSLRRRRRDRARREGEE